MILLKVCAFNHYVVSQDNPLDCRLTISDLELTAYIDGEEICTAKHSPGFSLEVSRIFFLVLLTNQALSIGEVETPIS